MNCLQEWHAYEAEHNISQLPTRVRLTCQHEHTQALCVRRLRTGTV